MLPLRLHSAPRAWVSQRFCVAVNTISFRYHPIATHLPRRAFSTTRKATEQIAKHPHDLQVAQKIVGRRPDEGDKRFKATVIGAGPAGIAAVGNLLEQGQTPILWIAKSFNGGRLNSCYREVPSNTKVKRFVMYADGVEPFKKIVADAEEPNAYTHLKSLDQEATCHIAEAADLCKFLTDGLLKTDGVFRVHRSLSAAAWTDGAGWSINYGTGLVNSDILVLCTGSGPTKLAEVGASGTKRGKRDPPLDLDIALKPSRLTQLITRQELRTVGVIGASHSAILVLRNLYNMAASTHPMLRIFWFTRSPLRYAVEKDGWILRDNTGLKGEVAVWAAENLEEDKLLTSDVNKYLTKVDSLHDLRRDGLDRNKKQLQMCDHIIHAVGFTPKKSFQVLFPEEEGKMVRKNIHYNHETGGFSDKSGDTIKGLYGAGIAYPERVVDPEGNVEYAVGLWKFMSYLKRVVPNWIAQ